MEAALPQPYYGHRIFQHKVGAVCYVTTSPIIYFPYYSFMYNYVYLLTYFCFFSTAGSDYRAAHEPIVFRINTDNRICVDITLFNNFVRGEFYKVFLVNLTAIDAPLFADETIVVILDQG